MNISSSLSSLNELKFPLKQLSKHNNTRTLQNGILVSVELYCHNGKEKKKFNKLCKVHYMMRHIINGLDEWMYSYMT